MSANVPQIGGGPIGAGPIAQTFTRAAGAPLEPLPAPAEWDWSADEPPVMVVPSDYQQSDNISNPRSEEVPWVFELEADDYWPVTNPPSAPVGPDSAGGAPELAAQPDIDWSSDEPAALLVPSDYQQTDLAPIAADQLQADWTEDAADDHWWLAEDQAEPVGANAAAGSADLAAQPDIDWGADEPAVLVVASDYQQADAAAVVLDACPADSPVFDAGPDDLDELVIDDFGNVEEDPFPVEPPPQFDEVEDLAWLSESQSGPVAADVAPPPPYTQQHEHQPDEPEDDWWLVESQAETVVDDVAPQPPYAHQLEQPADEPQDDWWHTEDQAEPVVADAAGAPADACPADSPLFDAGPDDLDELVIDDFGNVEEDPFPVELTPQVDEAEDEAWLIEAQSRPVADDVAPTPPFAHQLEQPVDEPEDDWWLTESRSEPVVASVAPAPVYVHLQEAQAEDVEDDWWLTEDQATAVGADVILVYANAPSGPGFSRRQPGTARPDGGTTVRPGDTTVKRP